MTQLVWDQVGQRVYENGLDRGVLYLSDGTVVPWNGLTSVKESTEKELTTNYFDGAAISNVVNPGHYEGTIKAITFPDEFLRAEGVAYLKPGFFVTEQIPESFGLSYRSLIGDDVNGDSAGYKLHVMYNLTAVPADKEYETITDTTEPMEFEWDILAVPESAPGLRPTANFIADSRLVDPALLAAIEDILYGTVSVQPSLPRLYDLVTMIREW